MRWVELGYMGGGEWSQVEVHGSGWRWVHSLAISLYIPSLLGSIKIVIYFLVTKHSNVRLSISYMNKFY